MPGKEEKRSPRTLQGRVAAVTGPKDPAAASEVVLYRVISAAVAYVTAWRDWNEGEGYAPSRRQLLHRAQAELVAAVEGMKETPQGDME